MEYVVIRGEYPFDEIVNVVDAPEGREDLALGAAKMLFEKSKDVYLRHPVVEPLQRGSLML
jgi:hypothetical protein